LEALLCQSRAPNEIVIVDGGSTDGTSEIIEEYAKRHSPLHFYVELDVNIARGRNIAVQRASYPVIAVTDVGCLPHRDWLRELVRPLMEDETIQAVAGSFEVDWRNNFEFFSGLLCMPQDFHNEETRLFYGRSSAFRKTLWEAVGGYPEWLYTAEDTLFAMRAKQLGFKIAYATKSAVAWRPRSTLRKLAKMFFLYGRGNGRINRGSLKGTLYWLRYHALWAGTLVFGIAFPWLWLLTLATLGFLYVILILPVLRKVRQTTGNLSREFYVPLIVITRNLSTNLGYLLGKCEYHFNPVYREKLRAYSLSQRKSSFS